MRKSSEDNQNLEEIYIESVLVEMDVGSVVGGVGGIAGGGISNVDGYATGDNRIPKGGAVQTRRGKVKKKGRKKRKN